jgi:hypothetical protein
MCMCMQRFLTEGKRWSLVQKNIQVFLQAAVLAYLQPLSQSENISESQNAYT